VIELETKFAIIGAGLAGTTLAWKLEKQSSDFQIIDANFEKASFKAAGIINPVVFKRLTKSFMVDDCLPEAKNFYFEVEKKLKTKFFFEKTLLKTIKNIADQNQWEAKIGESNFEEYLNPTTNQIINGLKNYHAWGSVKHAGYVDTKTYISKSHEFFQKKNKLQIIKKPNSYSQNGNEWLVKNENLMVKAERVIFCEGPYAAENPLWSFLPFALTKGETLLIKAERLTIESIIKKDFFLLPLKNGIFKVGATYNWNDTSWEKTEKGKQTLIEKLEEIIDCPYEILEHTAGVRPNTKDRRPFLGEHHTQKGLFIFNGLGSKGVVLAPHFADMIVNFVADNKSLNNDFDINRYFSNE